MEQWLFWPVAFLSLASAVLMLVARNAVHSALLLVANFFTLAVLYVMLDADFLASVQVIVYAGAIMVLFLFVIMLLGVDKDEDITERSGVQRWLAGLSALGLAATTVITLRTAFAAEPFRGLRSANEGGNVEAVGRVLFTKYLWPFELTSLLLIIAAIGAIVVGRRAGHDPSDADEVDPEEASLPPEQPVAATVPHGGPVAETPAEEAP